MKLEWKLDEEGYALLSNPPGFSIALAKTGRGKFYTLWRHKAQIKQIGPIAFNDKAGRDEAIADLKTLAASEASKTPASSTRR